MGKINLKAGTGKSKASTPPQEKQTEVLGVLDFGPSLIDGESAADYEAFRQGCHKAIEPKDEIERVWLGDFITYTWEAQRLRRMKTVFLPTARKEAVETLVKQFGGEIVNPMSGRGNWCWGHTSVLDDHRKAPYGTKLVVAKRIS